jgi:DGQHR domain-containing protein
LRDYLLAELSDEEREYIAELKGDGSVTPLEFVRDVFANLNDPLLSANDFVELWGPGASEQSFLEALQTLETDGFLDSSIRTQRPFDDQGIRLYRNSVGSAQKLILNAIESQSGDGTSRYQFSIEARLIRDFARIDRLDALAGSGNQRGEIRNHVFKIRDGIKGGSHIPNPVLLIFAESATQLVDPGEEVPSDLPSSFVVVRALEDFQEVEFSQGTVIQRSRVVEIQIPWRRAAFDEEKSILLVDGQQRTAAASLISNDDVPFIDVGVAALVSDESKAKRIFQIANETVKISTDFSKALLASMADAPGYLKDEQITAEVVRLIALTHENSPFFQIVRYPGTKGDATKVLVYNTIFGVVSNFRTNLPEDLANDPETLASVLEKAFDAVKTVWPNAWAKTAGKSKLMHGAGLRAIAQVIIDKLQNYLSEGLELSDPAVWDRLKASLTRLGEKILWTEDDFVNATATQKKNYLEEIAKRQNTNQDIGALTAFLTRTSVTLDMKAARGK